MKTFILHEGVVRMSDGELSEEDYDDIADLPVLEKKERMQSE